MSVTFRMLSELGARMALLKSDNESDALLLPLPPLESNRRKIFANLSGFVVAVDPMASDLATFHAASRIICATFFGPTP